MSSIVRLNQIFLHTTKNLIKANELILSKSDDLICRNLLCQKVLEPCICRLDMALNRLSIPDLKKVDLSNNNLTELPPSLKNFIYIEELNIEKNCLAKVPDYIYCFKNLKIFLKDAI